jgi:hypothetical protein
MGDHDGYTSPRTGARYPRVSSVLDVWSEGQDALLRWAARKGPAFERVRDESACVGTQVHEWIEQSLLGRPLSASMLPDRLLSEAMTALEGWRRWREAHLVEVVATEMVLVSDALAVGGTVDLVARIDGRLTIADWKTSSGHRPRHVVQVEAYAAMYLEQYPTEPVERRVVRLDKRRAGMFTERTWDQCPAALQLFANLRLAYEAARQIAA